MKQHLIAIDLDGTTLNNQSKLTNKTISTLRALDQQGHLVTIVTGRPYRNSKEIYEAIGINAPIINFNGALLHFPSRPDYLPTYHTPLNKEIAFDIIANQDNLGIDLICAEGSDRLFATSTTLPDSPFYPIDQAKVDRLNRQTMTEDPTALTIFSSESQLPHIEANLTAQYGDQIYVRTWGGLMPCLEVCHKDINKAYALQKLADFYHIPLDNIIAFGDENNDLEMLAYAGLGVAMLNGTDEVKAVANDITRLTNDQDGLADYLIHHFGLQID